MSQVQPSFKSLIGEVVVFDLRSEFVCVGTLADVEHDYYLLSDADMHDLRDTPTTRDQYVLQCRRDGMTPNRQWAWVRREELVGMSRLADVIIE